VEDLAFINLPFEFGVGHAVFSTGIDGGLVHNVFIGGICEGCGWVEDQEEAEATGSVWKVVLGRELGETEDSERIKT
jgi:hypothetical protein